MAQEWRNHPARALLAKALKEGDIPIDGKDLGPKKVYEKYKDTDAFNGVEYNATFTRRLRDLRKAAETSSEDKKVDWKKHPAKAFLYNSFKDKVIPVGYSETIGPKGVWDNHCASHAVFSDLNYDSNFVRRLKSVETYYVKKHQRQLDDQIAFDLFRKNNPIKWEGRWAGSDAQKEFKQDMKAGKNKEFKSPKAFHASNPKFKEFGLTKFRNHIYQEKRLVKFNNYVDHLKAKASKGDKADNNNEDEGKADNNNEDGSDNESNSEDAVDDNEQL